MPSGCRHRPVPRDGCSLTECRGRVRRRRRATRSTVRRNAGQSLRTARWRRRSVFLRGDGELGAAALGAVVEVQILGERVRGVPRDAEQRQVGEVRDAGPGCPGSASGDRSCTTTIRCSVVRTSATSRSSSGLGRTKATPHPVLHQRGHLLREVQLPDFHPHLGPGPPVGVDGRGRQLRRTVPHDPHPQWPVVSSSHH